MRHLIWAAAAVTGFTTGSFAQEAPPAAPAAPPAVPAAMPFDTPITMRAVEAVCTGIGADARQDPRWGAYPLKVELAGKLGQLLGDAQVTVMKGEDALATVSCGGPWVLFKVMPGAYRVKVDIADQSKTGRVNVGAKGQARIIMRFPDIGGATSPDYVPQ